jgi:hypothetical protein
MCYANSIEFDLYDNSKMHIFWRLILGFKGLSLQLICLASLCTVKHCQQSLVCEYCNFQYDNLVVHFMTPCGKYDTARQVFWDLVVDNVSVACSAYFNSLPDGDFISLLFRKELFSNYHVSTQEIEETIIICAKVWFCLRHEYDKLGLWLSKPK